MDLVLSRQAFLEMIWQWHGDRRGCYRHVCLACGRTFYASRPNARYCRGACRQRAYRRRLRGEKATLADGVTALNISSESFDDVRPSI